MQTEIFVKGARANNLKNIDVAIPRDKLVVITGLSGSGKSSLAFDTIYAEGQRRYVESLSSYARMFLGQMEKPDVDYIDGLSPAISIDQKTTSKNPRSTVGTVTEVYDYLRLLWARIGTPHCPNCGKEIRQQSIDQIIDQIMALPEGTRIQVLAPVIRGKKGEHAKVLENARKSGYVRVRADGNLYELTEEIPLEKNKKHSIEIVVDRLVIRPDITRRLTDSVETAASLEERGCALCLSVRNEDDQRRGVGKISLSRPGTPEYFLDTLTFYSVIKAESAPVVAFQKGNFRNCYDLYLTRDWFASEEKVTAVNPQKDDYRWGRAELFQWKAYDGTPLKGLVFIPDGVKDTDKLPVMVYFYEKYSEDLYAFRTPAPSRSTVNITFYTSRGYICFIPDIVYKVGHPGQSAYNCICSGAEALCAKYPFADKSKMAIQGQSWGGYQTAWLVTHTDMFAAAGAGAPVSNMTSAYGGIRWESGITRAGQYERGQSRIGKSLWEEGGLDLYIENSPAFFADKVNTPLLIMHNDADGAVPWYQGIEYFSDLRRLDKRVWMLQYNNEAHNLIERKNCLDLSRRLQQFFDHYLKGEPMPAWLKYGVPATRKGEYFGFEPAE